jgi:hypothetical protein
LKLPKWLQSLRWRRASAKSAEREKARRHTDQMLKKQQRTQTGRPPEPEKSNVRRSA